MNPTQIGLGLGIVLFVGMVVMIELGRLFGQRTRTDDGAQTGRTAIGGAVYGLLALLIAFTFSGAATRFDSRRYLIADEANAIGTAYLRLDLLRHGRAAGRARARRRPPLTGYDISHRDKRNWVHVLRFSIILSVTVYVILDIEYPRLGFIRIDAIDEVMTQLRAGMK